MSGAHGKEFPLVGTRKPGYKLGETTLEWFMRRLHHFLICLILSSVAAGCVGQPSLPGTDASPGAVPTICAPDETVQDDPGLADALRSGLEEAKLTVIEVSMTAHLRQCRDAESGQGESSAMTGLDTAVRISARDLTETAALSNTARRVTAALEEVSPGMPGEVALTFVSGDVEMALSFTRDLAREALGSYPKGESMLTALGYPPGTNSPSGCTPVWGKQPLPGLSQIAREEVDKAELSTIQISAAVTGTWCGDQFSAIYTEFHIDVGWLHGTSEERNEEFGKRLAPVIEIVESLPPSEVRGDLPPRLILVSGWFTQTGVVVTLPEARSAVEDGLSGALLIEELRKRSVGS